MGARWMQSVLLTVSLLTLGAWIGFSVNLKPAAHDAATPAGAAPIGPPQPRPKRVAMIEREHEERLGPEAIRQHDWTANGRFVRRPPAPYVPGMAYPPTRPLVDIVGQWNPDNVTIPFPFVEDLAVFNYSVKEEREMARTYRDAELPFKIFGIPQVEVVRNTWTDEYLIEEIDVKHTTVKIERSENNHFMYWTHKGNVRKTYPGWESPTEIVAGRTFKEWLGWAHDAEEADLEAEVPHHYLMMGTQPLSRLMILARKRDHDQTRTHFVVRDLPIFTPQNPEGNFFVTNPAANKGIQCRFGMRGVIAEAHYDGGRNMVAMLKGAKRYVLTAPSTCKHLEIIPDRQHPSFRHSSTDWSNATDAQRAFASPGAVGVDTVLREGEVLYIPSYWIHYICSLKYSIQCNTRSGAPPEKQGEDEINDCVKDPATRYGRQFDKLVAERRGASPDNPNGHDHLRRKNHGGDRA